MWFLDGSRVNTEEDDNSDVEMQRSGHTTSSELRISAARQEDAGYYTCQPVDDAQVLYRANVTVTSTTGKLEHEDVMSGVVSLALCEGNPPVTPQRSSNADVDDCFVASAKTPWKKQSHCRWFETLWYSCNVSACVYPVKCAHITTGLYFLWLCSLQWRHNECDGVATHRGLDCLFNRLFRRRSKKTSKLRLTSLSEGNSSVTGEFPAQRASSSENVFIWWRHHVGSYRCCNPFTHILQESFH